MSQMELCDAERAEMPRDGRHGGVDEHVEVLLVFLALADLTLRHLSGLATPLVRHV